jgi:hypothetical protein
MRIVEIICTGVVVGSLLSVLIWIILYSVWDYSHLYTQCQWRIDHPAELCK